MFFPDLIQLNLKVKRARGSRGALIPTLPCARKISPRPDGLLLCFLAWKTGMFFTNKDGRSDTATFPRPVLSVLV